MGTKVSKPSVAHYHFNKLGLSNEEVNRLQDYHSEHAGQDLQLNYHEFKDLLMRLSPEIVGPQLDELTDRAFTTADKNKDGSISFDEFIAFYVMMKSRPDNFRDNMFNLLNAYHGDTGYLTQKDATYYSKWAYNYTQRPSDLPDPEELVGNFGDKIPIEHFVNRLAPQFSAYL